MPFCTKCGAAIDAEAKFCGQCGREVRLINNNPTSKNDAKILPQGFDEKAANKITAGIVAAIFLLVFVIAGGSYLAEKIPNPIKTMQHQAENDVQSMKSKVAEDAVHQYYMVKNDHGGKIEKCVQAGIAAAAYLQAQDQHDYEQWHQTERMDCAIAGLPMR